MKNQRGFVHLQLFALLGIVVLAVGLTFWRINKTTSQAAHISNEVPQTEILKMAKTSDFIDGDHDLIPECEESQTTDCESKEKDHDFDNDGVGDNEDADDDNDGVDNNQDEDNDNDGQTDDHETDSDNDSLDDSEDPDDDNDGHDDNDDSSEQEDSDSEHDQND